jgi:hypothetical protein
MMQVISLDHGCHLESFVGRDLLDMRDREMRCCKSVGKDVECRGDEIQGRYEGVKKWNEAVVWVIKLFWESDEVEEKPFTNDFLRHRSQISFRSFNAA